jgi:drug/metabolite transporter (DMT)-like permease
MKIVKRSGELILLAASIIWGTAFIFQSIAMEGMGPFLFVTARSLIASVVMGLLVLIRARMNPTKQFKHLGNKKGYRLALLTGLSLTLAMVFQQLGMVGTTAGKAGFLTTLYIVFVPFIGILFAIVPPKVLYVSTPLAVIGFYFLSVQDNFGTLNGYDLWILGSAIGYAVQILLIDQLKQNMDTFMFSFLQFSIATVLSLIPTLLFEAITFDFLRSFEAIYSLLYVGVMSSCIAYTMQVIGQKRSKSASFASLIMSLESIFAVLAGVLFLQEVLTGFQLLGMGFIFTSITMITLFPNLLKNNKENDSPPSKSLIK